MHEARLAGCCSGYVSDLLTLSTIRCLLLWAVPCTVYLARSLRRGVHAASVKRDVGRGWCVPWLCTRN